MMITVMRTMMNIMTKAAMVIGFVTTMVAMSTAENADGEKFVFCIIAGVAGLILLGLGVSFATLDNARDENI